MGSSGGGKEGSSRMSVCRAPACHRAAETASHCRHENAGSALEVESESSTSMRCMSSCAVIDDLASMGSARPAVAMGIVSMVSSRGTSPRLTSAQAAASLASTAAASSIRASHGIMPSSTGTLGAARGRKHSSTIAGSASSSRSCAAIRGSARSLRPLESKLAESCLSIGSSHSRPPLSSRPVSCSTNIQMAAPPASPPPSGKRSEGGKGSRKGMGSCGARTCSSESDRSCSVATWSPVQPARGSPGAASLLPSAPSVSPPSPK